MENKGEVPGIDSSLEEMMNAKFSMKELNFNNSEDDDDDDSEEDVRALAASLAPAVQELDDLLSTDVINWDGEINIPKSARQSTQENKKGKHDPTSFDDSDSVQSEDSMNNELNRLAASEQLLRQELEFAHDFGSMMKTPDRPDFFSMLKSLDPPIEKKRLEFDDDGGNENQNHKEDPSAGTQQEEEVNNMQKLQPQSQTKQEHQEPNSPVRHSYTVADHSHHLQIQTEARGGWYFVPIVQEDLREYIIPIPDKELQRLYVGLFSDKGDPAGVSTQAGPQGVSSDENLPIRTLGMKIRPDVLVGAVMDGLVSSLQDDLEITKRQGGHLILEDTATGLLLDFQMCTYKGTGSRFCERVLMLRIFYSETMDVRQVPQIHESVTTTPSLKLKESAALVQKMETSKRGATEESFLGNSFFSKQSVFANKKTMQQAIADALLKDHKPCPSVKEGHLTLPSLSTVDWPWVVYTWKFIEKAWEELQDRDLTYSSLQSSPFGKFPNLPTLDTHYCSHLRRLCRENMIISLLKSASELEQYAREAEYACATLIQALKPTFELYQVQPPGLPQPLPLTAYPLNFTPHQATCPPWGKKVMEALNEVAAFENTTNANSFERAETAVQKVLDALQRQDDEEQSARLGRKNLQVMDRLAKMQAHKRSSIEVLKLSYSNSPRAMKAAKDFHYYAQKANSSLPETEEVPLYKCSILVGSSTGSCYVTPTQLMFVTQLIPVIGGNTVTVLDLVGLEFLLIEPSSLLPAGISIRRGGSEIYAFRPSSGAPRLKSFLEIIQATGSPKPRSKSNKGNQLSMYGDLDAEARAKEN